MLIKEISEQEFEAYGSPEERASDFSDAHVQLVEEEPHLSSTLWRYSDEVFIEPLSGLGILFVRSSKTEGGDGEIHRYLFDRPFVLYSDVEFCIIPYECRISYKIYSYSDHKIIPVTTILEGNGYHPGLRVNTLYAIRQHQTDESYLHRSQEHPFWEIIWLTEGKLVCHMDGVAYELKSGQLLVLPPHRDHLIKAGQKGRLSFLEILFDGEMRGEEGVKGVAGHAVYVDDRIERLFHDIIRERKEEKPYAEDMIICNLQRILVTVVRNVRSDLTSAEIPPYLQFTVKNIYVSECIDIIRQNAAGTLSLSEIAQQLNISPTYLSSLFKRNTGMNISEYIRLMRLEKVKEMLRSKRYTITQISEIMGYCSPTYFSTEFKKQFGMSPKKYAEVYRDDS